MTYVAPSTVVAGQTYGASAHNVIVNDVIDHESRLGAAETLIAPFSAAWTSWTPTIAGLTVGNATRVSRYIQVGKWVQGVFDLEFGSTTAFTSGDVSFTAPVTPLSGTRSVLNTVWLFDTGVNNYPGQVLRSATSGANNSVFVIRSLSVTGSIVGQGSVTSTVPINPWGTGDRISVDFAYEAA